MRTVPTGYQLDLTNAMRNGESRVEQCSWCGLLAATTDLAAPAKLGTCPACGYGTWWRQEVPVGPFSEAGHVNLEVVWDWLRRWRFGPLPMEAGYAEEKASALADLAQRLGLAGAAPQDQGPLCGGCGLSESESPGFVRYLTGPWCLSCRRAALREVR